MSTVTGRAAPRTAALRRARRQARANRRLAALVRRLRGCLTDLPSASARVLTLRAGTASRPGLSPGATARALGVSAGHEARLERGALSSLRAAGRAGCGSAATPSILAVVGSHTLGASSPVFGTTASGASSSAAGSRTQNGGVTRSSVHRPAKPGAAPTRIVDRAATDAKGTPSWAVILALGLLALVGAAGALRQAVLGRRTGVAAAGHAPVYPYPGASSSASASASASAFAALPAVQSSAPASADEAPGTPDRWLPAELAAASRPTSPESARSEPSLAPARTPTPGTGLGPPRSAALPARSDGRQLGRLIAVAVTALIGWIARLLSRRHAGRH